jgi:AhpD family alkylhydroperoxidase
LLARAVTSEGLERAAPEAYLDHHRKGEIEMHPYRIHTPESAPEKSKPALDTLKQRLGLIPNLAATMAESPTLVNGFVAAFTNFQLGSFSSAERQALLLTNAVANRCAWAVAFHSTLALKEGIGADDVQAMREGRRPSEPRLAALSALARALIERRGHLEPAELAEFSAAGFGPDQVLEVIAGTAISTMANYAGNITRPELEAPFRARAWTA